MFGGKEKRVLEGWALFSVLINGLLVLGIALVRIN